MSERTPAAMGACPTNEKHGAPPEAESGRRSALFRTSGILALLAMITVFLYAPGLGGGFIFDDYPNIVDNPLVQPAHASPSELMAAALSSPSSELKRPISSLSFAVNFLSSGLDASSMKATNVALHAFNGWLVFFLCRALFRRVRAGDPPASHAIPAAIIAIAWLASPINLTAVLYVVQRMESLANIFVLIGLIGYIKWRTTATPGSMSILRGFAWLTLPTLAGVLAKETGVLLPLYALCVEAFLFRFRYSSGSHAKAVLWLHASLLIPALAFGSIWLAPALLDPNTWIKRDFTLATRLLSEPRVVVDYLVWMIWPTPSALSFYHDDFVVSLDAFRPWTTLPAIALLLLLGWCGWRLRRTRPLVSLGLAWFIACHTLTGTVLPLELVYEHRNYFASIGVFLSLAELVIWASRDVFADRWMRAIPWVAAMTLLAWTFFQTATTALAWGEPLRLAQELARRGPDSPRAQYELGRAYIIRSHYDPASPYVSEAYAPLERAASIPTSSILPQQALIFLNSRIGRPLKQQWWGSMIAKLETRPATVQDESSLDALSRCVADGGCQFPLPPLRQAFEAALRHPYPSGRLLAIFASFAGRSLHDGDLAYLLQNRAVAASPTEPAYRIGLARMAIDRRDYHQADQQLSALEALNIGGRIDRDITSLRSALDSKEVVN